MVLQMSCYCICSVTLMVPWVGLRCVIVVFPDHTHLLFYGRYLLVDSTIRLTSTKSHNLFQLVLNSAVFLLQFISSNQSESIHHFRKMNRFACGSSSFDV